MRKALVMILIVGLLLTGCSTVFDGSYYSVTPHSVENTATSKASTMVSSYGELQNALVDMAENGYQKTTFYINGFDPSLADSYMKQATAYIFHSSAVGSYAVDKIDYEIGTSGGKDAIVVQIEYLHSRSEILRIRQTKDMEVASTIIIKALENCDAGVVLLVEEYTLVDLTQLVEAYVNENPHTCMEMPQVTVALYPEQGEERVISMNFIYQTDRDTLRSMQETVAPIFSSAELYVRGSEGAGRKYEQLYSFLMERFDYKVETSITPTYSLLRHGVGDSKAFASVYATMCRQAGLECHVISGTKAGTPHYWNLICVEDMYYHVDLLKCSAENAFSMKPAGQMDGYVWDYSAYD